MFGLENQKKKKVEEFVFDLEKSLKTQKRQKEIRLRVQEQMQRIKEALRSGEDKDKFDKFGVLLHGYASLLKVMSRVSVK